MQLGANIDEVTHPGETALMSALNIVSLLLAMGAYVNAVRNDGKTALMMSIEQDNWAITNLLLFYDRERTPIF